MMSLGFLEMVFILLFAGGSPLSLPLSMPPLPEDPVLARVAPDECLWYLSLSGMASPDPSASNHVEQLLAEEDVRRFARELEQRLTAALKKGAPNTPEGALLAEEAPRLIKAALTRPLVAFVAGAGASPQGLAATGGMVVSLGDDARALDESLQRMYRVLARDSAAGDDSAWRPLPMPEGTPLVEWGVRDRYLVVGVGRGMADQIAARLADADRKEPAWLAEIRRQLTVPRVSMVHYFNVQTAVDMAAPILGGFQGRQIADALGVGNVRHYASLSGLDETGSVTEALLSLDGQPRGLLAAALGPPLSAADLAQIPRDASFAVALRADAGKMFADFLDLLDKIEPNARAEIVGGLAELQISLTDDVLASLGDTWCVFNSPGDGGLLFTGLTATVTLRDPTRLRTANRRLMAAVNVQPDPTDRFRREVRIAEFEYRGETVYFLNFIGEESPFAPAWCITNDRLIVSLYPQMIKAVLSRGSKFQSLADLPEVAAQFSGDGGPSLLSYQDTPSLVRLAYPVVQMLAGMMCSELQRGGLDVDISLLPSAAAVLPHLKPSMTTMRRAPEGLRVTSRGTLPANVGAAPLWLFVMPFTLASSSPLPADFPVVEEAVPLELDVP
jgi:hypothetical protein